MSCKGICLNYEKKKINVKNNGMYILGYKRCSECECFMDWKGANCPCCGYKFRIKPRNKNGRNQIKNKKEFEEFIKKFNLNKTSFGISQKLFYKLKDKIPFKFQSSIVVMSACVFIASRLNGQSTSLEKISQTYEIDKNLLEFTCEMVIDEIKNNCQTP